jgi:phosphoribosylamine--glycine ligase
VRILVVGGGGREHALCWGLARSPRVTELVAAPGNAGIAALARTEPGVSAEDVGSVADLVERDRPDLVVIGPEAPLVAGLADLLGERGVPVFGPSADAARLEGSKAFAKQVMAEGGIPTARAASFTDAGPALRYVDELGGRAVVKADGLAAGKGVTVAPDRAAAADALRRCLEERAFGEAGATVVVEEVIEGPEVSAFALVDGETVVPLALAQDFKRVGDGDTGPNTGGMGAYSPLPFVDDELERSIWRDVVGRTVTALRARGLTYRGLLYTGLMLTADGPKVLEYNCRFGDPETEAVIPRLACDLADLLEATATGHLPDVKVVTSDDAAVTVVLASGGYPGPYPTGLPIEGLDEAAALGATVFHAGTAERDGRVVTAGGRVLAVTGTAASIAGARAIAYDAAARIAFEGKTLRHDVAELAAGEEQL